MYKIKSHIIKLTILILLWLNADLFAQRISVPVDIQFRVIPKILSLNKNFNFVSEQEFNIGILYSEKQRNSNQVLTDFNKLAELYDLNIKSIPTNFVSIELGKVSNLREYLAENNIHVLYITPLRGVDIIKISKICKEEKVLTLTGVEEYVNDDISVILGLVKNKMKIFINRNSAKSEGVKFSSRLLSIAKIIE